jgi:hypothetical protein
MKDASDSEGGSSQADAGDLEGVKSGEARGDLAGRQAGEGVTQYGEQLRSEHPWKSRLGRLLRVQTEDAAYLKGGKGEVLVGKQLEKLSPEWRLLNSVPVGSSGTDIDHVVIGPGGVFTLNAKNHRGGNVWVHTHVIKVNGQNKPYLRVSRSEASGASKRLSRACGFPVAVRPVVVIVADQLTIKGEPEDVKVVGRKRVSQWLQALPRALGAEEIEAIYTWARRIETWA